jgi:hypothetical protein
MNPIKDTEIKKFQKELEKQIESCVKHDYYNDVEYGSSAIEIFDTEEALYKILEVLKKYNVL